MVVQMTLRENLIEEKKKIMQKHILSAEDMDLLDKINFKLLDMESIDAKDNVIRWEDKNIMVL
jgi:hypothetical protein